MRPEVAVLINQTWTQSSISDEAAFQAAANKVVAAILLCRRNDDIQGAYDWLECLVEARRFSYECPMATIYAHYLGLVSATLADWLVCKHQFTEAVNVAVNAWETLDQKDARRRALCLEPTPSIASRWRLLGVLADVKWRVATDEFRDTVLTPTQHVQAWLGYSQALHDELARPLPPEATEHNRQERRQRERRNIESLLWAGLWTACCAHRYCRTELLKLVREFNTWHARAYRSAGLALAERHWLEAAPLAPESPLYWHFEIAKQWLAEMKLPRTGIRRSAFTLDELEELYIQLRLSVEMWTAGRPDKVYNSGLELDYQWMREELVARQSATDQLYGPAVGEGDFTDTSARLAIGAVEATVEAAPSNY
jgi:hypothetical protein